jgi:hypothetical protein
LTDWQPTPADRGLAAGLRIHRSIAPAEWPAALAELPEDEREVAEHYLRGIAARIRAQREAVRRAKG